MNTATKPADWHERAKNLHVETRLFINGQFVESVSGEHFQTTSPVTGKAQFNMARGTAADIDRAVQAARASFKRGVWSRLAPRDRMDVLYRLAQKIAGHANEFALLDCLDMGKPISELINGDVPFSSHTFQFFAEAIDKMEGAVTNTASSALHMIMREPIGVVGCITPWNFPLMMAAWKTAPALAAGNSVVLKPAEQSPSSALLLARLFAEAGGPPGVFNVVNGLGEDAGKALALHNDVDKISFTGSTEVGKLMLIYAGQSNMKRVSTECGGKSPQIVFSDVEDIDTAVQYAVNGIYGNQGEVCSAGSRILVQRDIYPVFLEKFLALAPTRFATGDPLLESTTMGPLVTREQQARVVSYIEIGKNEGARLVMGGTTKAASAGFYVEPTLFADVTRHMRIAREEIFGPVAVLMPFDTEAQAVDIANDSIYGLAAGIWTANLNRAHRVARNIESGIVWVNCYDHGDMTQPWGGYKQSGQGRDKCVETLLSHTQSKSVWINLA